ncbi:MAG: TIGR00282 family metallophosphoesterase [Clostridia bacterium]|nr:TIGR00282 family metallophosphoesterase [Clostridia bacterium]MBQ6707960.1 TIGR00282 family metallophosphoesterase [Clostridia bacterium]
MNVLAIGDVVSENGCEFLRRHLPNLKRINSIDLCIVNGENSAKGNGITPESAEMLFNCGADVITTGNHAYRRREMYCLFDEDEYIIRPANYPSRNPGKGYVTVDMGRYRATVINLMGTYQLEPLENPFTCIDRILDELKDEKIIIVDFHAEATSEKKAMAYYLSGRVSALFGTHTHIQTSDEQIINEHTGYITDLGMTGPVNSVLGVKPEIVIEKFKYNMPTRFDTADGECMLNGCIFEIDDKTGKTVSVHRIDIR